MRARSRRAALATIFVEGLLGRLTFGMVSFALPLYAVHLGLSLTQIGVIVSTRSAFELPLKPLAGWLVDRTSVRTVYIGGIVMRCVSAVVLVLAGDFASLCLVRALHGASAAGRDVGSLSVLAREAGDRVGTHYGWYSTVRQVGNVGGAALAGLLIAAAGGGFGLVFAVVAAMSVLPLVVATVALREAPAPAAPAPAAASAPAAAAAAPAPAIGAGAGAAAPEPVTGPRRRRLRVALLANYAGLGGAASVGMLVAASAYMVHGIFPVLATSYAGLSNAQAGLIMALSTAVFCVAGPAFGWLSDHSGRTVALSLRSVCNIASSVLYIVLPSFAGLTAARCVDDSGKAAFRPAWASTITKLAAADPDRQGRRLGALDTASSLGELVGPILAGILWSTGGIVALFGVRILIAIVAEIAALRVFHGIGARAARRALLPRRGAPAPAPAVPR